MRLYEVSWVVRPLTMDRSYKIFVVAPDAGGAEEIFLSRKPEETIENIQLIADEDWEIRSERLLVYKVTEREKIRSEAINA